MRIGVQIKLYNHNLRQTRIDCGYKTVQEFCDVNNLAYQTYLGYETMRLNPSFETALKLSEIFDKDVEYLFPTMVKEISKSLKKKRTLYIVKEIRELGYENPDLVQLENQEDLRKKIYDELDTLSEREKMVIVSRFGLNGNKGSTYRQIGKNLGVGGTRVQQLESKALRKLRHPARRLLLLKEDKL